MDVDAAFTLDDVNYLQLAKHVLQISLKLFGLPVTKLFVRLLIVERDYLIAFNDLCTISLLLIALHDADYCLMPGWVTRGEQILPFGLTAIFAWHLEEEAILGDEYELWTGTTQALI